MLRGGLAALVLISCLLIAGPASADPVNTPKTSQGTIVCGDTTYNVVSAGNRTLTGSDVNSTREVLLILDKDPKFSVDMLTLCTAYPPPPDEPFSTYFFITPVR
jgi:hypothetical protein